MQKIPLTIYQAARFHTDLKQEPVAEMMNISVESLRAYERGATIPPSNVVISISGDKQSPGKSIVEAYAWDLETNTRRTTHFEVFHIRDTKQGPKILTEERDIYETIANQASRRMRGCILQLIPACACVFCGSGDDCINHKGKMVCTPCLESMRDQVI